MTATLYLTRNGLLEPLGQSQVFGYLRGLAPDYAITLISYEKSEDWDNSIRVTQAKKACELHGIRWLPQKFRQSPPIVAPALSMVRMAWLVWREVRAGRARLIHARSYIPAAVALVFHHVMNVPFIFDMRALWPEELITAGRLKRGSLLHRAIVAIERNALHHAAAVVSLTYAAVAHLKCEYPRELSKQRIKVIPTCSDLDRFVPAHTERTGPIVHGCVGTILSGWFRVDWLAAWLAAVAKKDAQTRFDIVTRDDRARVRAALDPSGLLGKRVSIGPRQSEEMPDAIRSHDVSIMFFTDGLSKLGSAPTRLGEVLGCGLPVVANAGVGDVAKIIRQYRIGVILDGINPSQISDAQLELNDLMQDPELPTRCRAAAEALFSLKAGTETFRAVYSSILKTEVPECAA